MHARGTATLPARSTAMLPVRVAATLGILVLILAFLSGCSLVIPDELAFLFETPTPRVIVKEVTAAATTQGPPGEVAVNQTPACRP